MLRIIFIVSLFGAVFTSFPHSISSYRLRISGGSIAAPGQFPHQASLRTANGNDHFCGGFVINERWIGSAAHCTSTRSSSDIIVVLGTNSRINGGTTYNISKVINHPKWNDQTIENDISLLQTSFRIIFTQLIKQIRLGSDYLNGGVLSIVSGWGQLSSDGPFSQELRFVEQFTLTNTDCNAQQPPEYKNMLFNSSICGFLRVGTGACVQDSGGPLISNGTVIGIVSWGKGCGSKYPNVYSRISSYKSWIEENIKLY